MITVLELFSSGMDGPDSCLWKMFWTSPVWLENKNLQNVIESSLQSLGNDQIKID